MKSKPTSYRVDLIISTGSYADYTSRKGVGLCMAQSLAEGLKRQGTGGRIVELPSGTVIEEWASTETLKPATALRDSIQALRDKHIKAS